ncbi:MAG: septation protein A [Alphaproteobacteria bacterium]|nr:septation protein A [Alphaproteobacteria bacterium]MBV9370256.1 septation protein A [Alphaproteobacteria bacterium]MBV9899741.1 septation protein A [Alphaproteobacteria bacterium]
MSEAPEKSEEPGALGRLMIDLGPLVVFFAANALKGIFIATAAFMVAIVIAMVVSLVRYRRVSPILWFSAFMVLVLGGLTLWFHKEWFIKIKPTIYYAMVAAILAFGLATGRNLLKAVLGTAYPGLSERGWQVLTRNWAIFFAVMAVVNEIVWRNSTTSFWVGFKLWGFLPATFLFALANVPMLMRHGMELDKKAEPPVPPSQ